MEENMRVIVVGGGLAGLACAYHLGRKGHSVQLLEARDRLGGRVVTWYDASGDPIAEGGAEFIDTHHRRVQRYARWLGLELRELPLGEQFHDELPGCELFWSSLEELSSRLRERKRPWLVPDELKELDRVSMLDWAERCSLSHRVQREIRLWATGMELAPPERVSVLGVLAELRQRSPHTRSAAYTLAGGLSRLVEALAAKARDAGVEIHLGRAVRRLEQTSESVRVHTDAGRMEAERSVLTVPTPLLDELTFHPEVPSAKRRAWGSATYGRLVKTLLRFSDRFWRTPDALLEVYGEVIHSIWEPDQASRMPTLVVWQSGEQAERWSKLDEPSRLEATLAALEAKLPGAQSHFLAGRSFDWSSDPYARGGYSHYGLGYLTEHAPVLPEPHRRIHFAGEHTSPHAGYMEGALESAHRAVIELVKSSGDRAVGSL